MTLSHSIRYCIAPRHLVPRVLLALTTIALSGPVDPARADIGRWSETSNWSDGEQARYAVHMLLLPGDNNPFHSKILWFQGEGVIGEAPQSTFYGGEWGWTPGNDDCSSYPTSNFESIGVDTSGMNPFCGSHTLLGDGRALVAGGHNPFILEYGDNRARIYKVGAAYARGTWSSPQSMNYWRWYPTATTMRDGRALLTSGKQYRQHRIFGGLRGGSAPTSPSGDTLRRFAPIPNGRWDAPLLPDTTAADGRPVPRYAHTAVVINAHPFGGNQVYFGGHGPQGLLNDTWFQRISNANELLADRQYSWVKPIFPTGTPPPPLPPERSDHTAIVALGSNMVVFGGLGADGALSDVWRFYYDFDLQKYRWSNIETSGTQQPDARFGHSAIYDETVDTNGATLRRMIVFGGVPATGQAPTDLKVWELRFDPTNLDEATWSVMTQVDLSTGVTDEPAPRYWHTLNADNAARTRDTETPPCHAALMFGGKLGATTCSDTLWKLWIFRDGTVGWERVAGGTPPAARARHSTVLDPAQSGYSARIYVYGGLTANGDPADSHVYVLDPWRGRYATWTQWSDLGISLSGQTSTLDTDPQLARTAEVYDPAGDAWTTLSSATLYEGSYPPVFLVPGGGNGNSRMINVNYNTGHAYWLDIPPTGQDSSWRLLPFDNLGYSVQAGVQYRPGRIMVAGGFLNNAATGLTKTLDTSNLTNSWVTSGGLAARINPNLVVLPGGKVLAVGGNLTGEHDSPMQWPQMWDPDDGAGVWTDTTDSETRLAWQPTPRTYHSTAILLPDGRVLSAGGSGDQGDPNSAQHLANIFCPPYLFKAGGGDLAARPEISDAAAGLPWGKVFTVCVTDTALIRHACLVRPGATTHAFDQNQRYVPLSFTAAASPPRLFVTSPASPDSAPPGYYMLFITGSADGADVPSIAKWVRLGPAGRDTCDAVRPKIITDLEFDVDPEDCTRFLLTWTAPGDDSNFVASGRATQYDMKVSSSSITTDWAPGTGLSRIPSSAGAMDSVYVTVAAGQNRYIRLKTKDDNALWAGISNQIHIFGPPTNSDCLGGDGMFAGGGGEGGLRSRPSAALAGLQPAAAAISGENTLLNGVTPGTKGGDMLRLSAVTQAAASSYLVRIREVAGHAARMDAARLLAVDHSPSVTAFVASGRPVLGTRVPPLNATDGVGTNVTALVNGSKAETFVGDSGAVITVKLGADSAVTADPVVIEASGLGWSSSGMLLQVPDGTGGWRTVDRVHPRLYFSELGVDSVGSNQVRLFLLGRHQVRFVGRVVRSSEQPTVQWGRLLRAHDSSRGDALSALSEPDSASLVLEGPDTLTLSFAAPPIAEGQVRECFLAVDATPLATAAATASSLRGSAMASVPTRFALWQNQPNPFSAATSIRFDLPVGAMVRLEVFDVQGRRVKLAADHYFPAGYQAVQWDRRDEGGAAARPGVYLYRVTVGGFRSQKKMVLLP